MQETRHFAALEDKMRKQLFSVVVLAAVSIVAVGCGRGPVGRAQKYVQGSFPYDNVISELNPDSQYVEHGDMFVLCQSDGSVIKAYVTVSWDGEVREVTQGTAVENLLCGGRTAQLLQKEQQFNSMVKAIEIAPTLEEAKRIAEDAK